MKRVFVFFLLFIAWTLNTWSQESATDSLELILKTTKNDTTRIRILGELSEVCEEEDILKYAVECSSLCEKALLSGQKPRQFYLKNLSGSLNNIGYYYSILGKKKKSLENYERALQIDEQLGDKKNIAIQLNNIAVNLFEQGDFSQALDYFYRDLKMQEQIGDKKGMGFSLNNIGYAYANLNEYDKALEYYNRGLKVCESINDKSGMAQTFHNTGLIYDMLKKDVKSLGYYNRSLALYEELGDELGICTSLGAIGSVYADLGNYDKALECLSRGLKISEKHGYKNVNAQCLFYTAEVFIRQGKFSEALPYAKRSLELSEEVGMTKETGSAARALRTIYAKQNRFKEAYNMFRLEVQMSDSVVNEANRKGAIRQELQYEYEKKELQTSLKQEKELSRIKLENQRKITRRNIWMYVLISLAVILGLSIFYLYKFFRQKNIINAGRNNELRQKLLLSQMNPHFIFNSVDNIQSLIHGKQDKEAISYLSKFSKLTRQILENSTENHITLDEELSMTENYLNIQQLLYNNSFTFEIEMDPSINKENTLIPPMLTQPFVENAIKHGLKNGKEGGWVQVRFYMKEQSLFFEVNDNGSGLATKERDGHRSMSTRIVLERLNNNAKKPVSIDTQNRMENNIIKGVTTKFEIPYICED
jgi:tetratricopeptide (TPR) repeat protein